MEAFTSVTAMAEATMLAISRPMTVLSENAMSLSASSPMRPVMDTCCSSSPSRMLSRMTSRFTCISCRIPSRSISSRSNSARTATSLMGIISSRQMANSSAPFEKVYPVIRCKPP